MSFQRNNNTRKSLPIKPNKRKLNISFKSFCFVFHDVWIRWSSSTNTHNLNIYSSEFLSCIFHCRKIHPQASKKWIDKYVTWWISLKNVAAYVCMNRTQKALISLMTSSGLYSLTWGRPPRDTEDIIWCFYPTLVSWLWCVKSIIMIVESFSFYSIGGENRILWEGVRKKIQIWMHLVNNSCARWKLVIC